VTCNPATDLAQADRLSGIASLTDAALSALDDETQLAEVLKRLTALLQADAGAILLVKASGQLTPVALVGLVEAAGYGKLTGKGLSLAGRVASEAAPVILDEAGLTAVGDQLLAEAGLRCAVGVPLLAAGEVIGVLCAGCRSARTFTAADAELAELAASRAVTAAQSLLGRDERAAAAALVRSLVPALDTLPGVELAARYVPGHGVLGGDWYDAFILPSGEMGIVIGDVAGSGLAAANVMGRIRSVLRSHALETSDPAEVLARLDRTMNHFEPDVLATIGYAVLSPGLDVMDVSSAGHLPPVIVAPGRPGMLADIATDLMIGLDPGVPRHTTRIPLVPGSLLYFYTDGLIERPDQLLDDSLELLCRSVQDGAPEAACAALMRALVGHRSARDDIALLTVLVQPDAGSAVKFRYPGDNLVPVAGRHVVPVPGRYSRWRSSCGGRGPGGWRTHRVRGSGHGGSGGPG